MKERQKVTIRPASPMDSVAIVRLIKADYAQTPAKQIGDLDEQKLLEYVAATLRHAFAVVADHGSGRTVGTIALAPIRVPWCNAVVMAESWFAVVEAHRVKGVPELLLDAAETFLDKNKLVGFLGTQMLTPASMNAIIAKRSAYMPSRHTFLRLPATATTARKAAAG